MKKFYLVLALLFFFSLNSEAQILGIPEPTKVNFDDYEKLIGEVKEHRKARLLNLAEFLEEAKKEGVILLDARSDSMYNAKHIAGAIHLNFSDFTQENLARVIPSFDTKILIYCNNNFNDDQIFFPTKMVQPNIINLKTDLSRQVSMENPSGTNLTEVNTPEPITLALNIPVYINLYGYGYRNVYELGQTVSVNNLNIRFEGTAVRK